MLHLSSRDHTIIISIPSRELTLNFTSSNHVISICVKLPEKSSYSRLVVKIIARDDLHFVALAVLASIVSTPFKVFSVRQKSLLIELFCPLSFSNGKR